MPQIASLFTSMTLEDQSFHVSLKKAVVATQRDVGKIQKTLSGLKTGLVGLAAGVATSGLLSAARGALDYAAGLGEISQQLGVTTRDLQVYRYIATQTGLEQGEMDKALQRLTRTMGEADAGGKKQATTFRDLGVAVRGSNGEVKTAGDVMPELADAISKIESPTLRAKVAYDLFGKSGQKMLPVLEGGSKSIEKMSAEVENFGGVMDDHLIAQADAAADKLAALQTQLEIQFAKAVAENADAVLVFADAFISLVAGIGDAISWLRRFGHEAAQAMRRARGWTITGERAAGEDAMQARSDYFQASLAWEQEEEARKKKAQLPPVRRPTGGEPPKPDSSGKKGRSSKPERDRTEEYRQQYLRELRGLFEQELSLQQQLTTDTRERAMIEHERIDRAQVAFVFETERAVRAGELTQAQADELKLQYAKNATLERAQVNRDLDAKLAQEELDLANAANDNKRDLLERDRANARTSKERARIELELLDLEYERTRLALEDILASKDATETQKEIARARLELLGTLQERDAERVARDNAGPLDQYLDGIAKSADELNESMERAAVDGLGDLKSGLAEVAIKGGNAFEVLTSALDRFLVKLTELALDQAFGALLGGGMFGGSGSGGFNFFGLFGGGGGGGKSGLIAAGGIGGNPGWGPDPFGWAGVSNPIGLAGLADGGSFRVDGKGGIDRNVLSINGQPRAMVSASERINVTPANDRGRAPSSLEVVPSKWFDLIVDGKVISTGGGMMRDRDRKAGLAQRQRVDF